MTELSPAALTVWSAFLDHYEWEVTQTELCAVAAALRAAADQVAPNTYKCYTRNLEWDAGMEARTDAIRENLLAIADELEAH